MQTNYLINNEPRPNAITHEKAFLLTLWYLANTETFHEVSDRFDVTQSSSHRVLQQTLNIIIWLTDEFICWPHDLQEKLEISHGFGDLQGVDCVIGVIDGTHIGVVRPMEDQRDYYDRKRYHSILLQAIVTSDGRIIDVHMGEPGSMHNARMLHRSPMIFLVHSAFSEIQLMQTCHGWSLFSVIMVIYLLSNMNLITDTQLLEWK